MVNYPWSIYKINQPIVHHKDLWPHLNFYFSLITLKIKAK